MLAYSSISAIGTCAWMTWLEPRASLAWTRPRRLDQVAHDVAHVLVGDRDLDVHDGLEQRWAAPARWRP